MSQLKKKTEVNQRTMFCHYRTEDVTFTVAYEFINSNTVSVGYAYCSKKDQFNKSIGRAISTGRLVKSPNTFQFSTVPTIKEVVNAVIQYGVSDFGDYELTNGKQVVNV